MNKHLETALFCSVFGVIMLIAIHMHDTPDKTVDKKTVASHTINDENVVSKYSYPAFKTEALANYMLKKMSQYVKTYGAVTIGDVYDICGSHLKGDADVYMYGWKNVDDFSISQKKTGSYFVKTPFPEYID